MKNLRAAALLTLTLFTLSSFAFAQKLKPEEILAKHLDSIGTAQARAADKSRIAVGDAEVIFVTQKSPAAKGRIVLASAGAKNFLGLNTNSINYPLEKLSYDGSRAKVGFVRTGVRSVFGNFVVANGILVEDGLLGGTLSSSWAMLNIADKKVKLTGEGTKKIDGREAYAIGYAAKSDLDITLYFDKETFRHVRTEYKRTSSAGIGTRPEQSSGFSESRIKLTEDFSDFKEEKGITLPHTYKMNYSITGQNGTTEIQFNFLLNEFAFNQNLDAGTFDAEAN